MGRTSGGFSPLAGRRIIRLAPPEALLLRLKALTKRWLPAERPQRWRQLSKSCANQALASGSAARWRTWLKDSRASRRCRLLMLPASDRLLLVEAQRRRVSELIASWRNDPLGDVGFFELKEETHLVLAWIHPGRLQCHDQVITTMDGS